MPFSFATAGEVSVFNVHFSFGEALRDFGQNTGLVRGFDRQHVGFERENTRFAKSMSALVGSLTTMRTTVWSTVSDVASA